MVSGMGWHQIGSICPPLIYGAKYRTTTGAPSIADVIERILADYAVPRHTFQHLTNIHCLGSYPIV